jgi:hypothetical protein
MGDETRSDEAGAPGDENLHRGASGSMPMRVGFSCISLVCGFLKKSFQSLAYEAFPRFRGQDRVSSFANSFRTTS